MRDDGALSQEHTRGGTPDDYPPVSAHTPGTWKATKGYSPTVVSDGGHVIAGSIGGKPVDSLGGVRLGEVDANARLIAAAPDLLRACMDLLECTDAELGDVMKQAEAAIHKATAK